MLKLSHISKTFNPGTVNEKVAIRDLSLHLEKGDFATIIGSNGAGKSTLMKILTGVYTKDAGTVLVDGKEVNYKNPQEAEKAGIVFIYQ